MKGFRLLNLLMLLILFSGCSNSNLRNSETGRDLHVLKNLQIGPCNDAAVYKNILFVIGSNSIFSFDISSPKNPVLLNVLPGLGNVRQIEVQDDFAYVTSREEGLFIIDVSNPEHMVKTAHYDTLELGTGIAVSGLLAAVTNRQYGVEFVDISNLAKPVFLGMIRTGEAQSVFLIDSLAVIGDWGTRDVTLCSISNPRRPKIISKIDLDGYGDGVFVKGNLCFAATGHHARGWNENNKDSTYWGKGHGLEIIDISDPNNPVKLSILKFPVKFHQRYADMWDVQVVDNYAFVCDSEAGLFVVDISDPRNPFVIGQATIPEAEMPKYMNSGFKGRKKSGPVGGFALENGVVYIAGKMNDLYIADAKSLAKPIPVERPYWSTNLNIEKENPASRSVYLPDGQVHSAFLFESGDKALIAAGDGGVHEVTLSPKIEGKQILKTGTIVFDVYYKDAQLYLAEGNEGMSVWSYDVNNTPILIGRYKSENGGVYQLLIDPEQKHAFLHVGANTLEFIDISDLRQMKRIGSDKQLGLMYRLPIARGLLDNRFIACSWHITGCFFYDVKGGEEIKFSGQGFPALGVINGVAFLKDKSLAIYHGGYVIQNSPDKPQMEIKESIRVGNAYLEGKPTISNSRMYVSNRMKGILTAVDISKLESPKKVWQLNLSGNPGLVVENHNMVIVPGGRSGLQLFKRMDGRPYYED